MSNPVWLITGGCGFIGTRLIGAILERDGEAAIRVVDNLSVGTLADLRAVAPAEIVGESPDLASRHRGIVQVMCGDVMSAETMRRAAQGAQVIVHLAANTGVAPSVEDPLRDCMANVVGTLNTLEGARHAGVGRFVFASSGAPVGEVLPPIHEEVVPHPVSPYGASKLAGEGYCSAYARTFGLQTVVLRFGNVYGPGSNHKSSVIAKFIRDAATTGVLTIYGDGRQTRDFIYVDDLVQAILMAVSCSEVGGEVFQIATNRETSVEELATLLTEILPRFGIAAPRVSHNQPRICDVRRNYSDTTKARQRLGWQATTTINDGIEKTIRWFMDTMRHERTP